MENKREDFVRALDESNEAELKPYSNGHLGHLINMLSAELASWNPDTISKSNIHQTQMILVGQLKVLEAIKTEGTLHAFDNQFLGFMVDTSINLRKSFLLIPRKEIENEDTN